MKVDYLSGAALGWAVAKCEGLSENFMLAHEAGCVEHYYQYSTNWLSGGPIIEREGIVVERGNDLIRHEAGLPGV